MLNDVVEQAKRRQLLDITLAAILQLEKLDTSARGARRDLRHRQQLRLRALRRLEGLARTFGFASDVALAATSARGARRHLQLRLRRRSRH